MVGGIVIYVVSGIVMVIATVLFIVLIRAQKKTSMRLSLSRTLLSVQLPHAQEDSEKGIADINLSEQLFSFLSSVKGIFALEAAVHHMGEETHFYIAAPTSSVESISRQIEGLFEGAVVQEAGDYNIFHEGGATSGVVMQQDKNYSLPVRTYEETKTDTFSPIVSGLSKINAIGEGAAIQVVVSPAPSSYKKNILAMINDLRKGESFEKIASKHSISIDAFTDVIKPQESNDEENKPSIVDEATLKKLEEKVSHPLFRVNYRVIASAPNDFQAQSLCDGITSSFKQFEAPLHNALKPRKARNIKKFAYDFSFRVFNESDAMTLNARELASIFHLPTASTLSPSIKWLKSRQAAPPANLSSTGTLIGESNYRGQKRPIYISDEDRHRHIYIVGQTGTGKSSLLNNMIYSDIKNGKGVAVLDPHGDLAEEIAGLVPPERKDDVIYFNPSNVNRPIGLNMLEYDINHPEEKTFIVNEMMGIFDKLYDLRTTGGPMFEMYMRNALLLLLEDAPTEPTTLMEIQRVFIDSEYRERKLNRISNPIVIDFWSKEATKAGGDASLASVTPYITSKFNNFTANDYMRPIIGQTSSAFNFRSAMDEGKILIANLSKGRIGDINANLLGMIISGKILQAALSRVDIPEQQRRDFNLYIDEFQNFTTDSISVILSEARKYRLNLVIAHQFIAQLEDSIRDAVFGNVGSMIAFRVGAQDAEVLEKQFEPTFTAHDLINIDNFNAYVKLLLAGQTSTSFNITTFPKSPSDIAQAQALEELSAQKYGMDRQQVEEDILRRLRN